MKNQYRGGRLPKKGVLDCLLIYGGLGKKEGGGVFEGAGGDPNAHCGPLVLIVIQ